MEALKKGVHARYQGKEYRATVNAISKNVDLYSNEPSSTAFGFVSRRGKFVKEVAAAEVESVYTYKPYAKYGEVQVQVLTIKKDGVEFIYNGTEHADELLKSGFEQIDRYSYTKFVPEQELPEINFEVSPMPGYKLPEDLA